MDNESKLFNEIKVILEELVQTNKMVLQSHQILMESNNELKKLFLEKSHKLEQSEPLLINNFTPSNVAHSKNLNAELFKKIAEVYYNEEIERIKSNNVRKSARRVSVELGKTIEAFLCKNLSEIGLTFQRFPDGLIYIQYEGKFVGAIKFLTDIGFHRGEQWNEYVKEVVKHCKKLDVKKSRIFFIISSLRNGLEQKHVSKLLNTDIRSNWDFMNNRILVEEYVEKFISMTPSLPNPHKQIYIMASEMHPNVLADDLHKMNEVQKIETFRQVEQYPWISDLNDFLRELHHLA